MGFIIKIKMMLNGNIFISLCTYFLADSHQFTNIIKKLHRFKLTKSLVLKTKLYNGLQLQSKCNRKCKILSARKMLEKGGTLSVISLIPGVPCALLTSCFRGSTAKDQHSGPTGPYTTAPNTGRGVVTSASKIPRDAQCGYR